MARLARALNTDALADVDLRQLAKKVRAQGRGRDTVLAHITPQEAKLLKRRGGRGSINPKTGLPEFEDDFDFGGDFGGGDYVGGGDNNVVYEYYDEPAPQQEFTGDGGEGNPAVEPGVGVNAAQQQGQTPTVAAPETPTVAATEATPSGDKGFDPNAAPNQGLTPDPNKPESIQEDKSSLHTLLGSLGRGGSG